MAERSGITTGERKGIAFSKLVAVLALLAATGAVGVWFAWRTLIHYERRAALHLPPDTQFAVWLDVERVALFEPVRRHLLPIVDQLPLGSRAEPDSPGATSAQWTRVLRASAGLNLARDLREVVFATVEGGGWVVLLGGLFPEEGLVPSIETALREHGADDFERRGDTLVFSRWEAALGQASDGILMLASEPRVLDQARPVTERAAEIGLQTASAGSLALSARRLDVWLDARGSAEVPDSAPTGGLSAALTVGRNFVIAGSVGALHGARTRNAVEAIRKELQFATDDDRPVRATEWEGPLLARLEVSGVPGEDLQFRTFIEPSELDLALRALNARLQLRLWKPAARAPAARSEAR